MSNIALLNRAFECVDGVTSRHAGLVWTLGGGTALELRYHHRTSLDIDVFLPDPQWLVAFSPRVNARIEAAVSDYEEASNVVSLTFPEGRVDILVAPSLTGLPPSVMEIDERVVLVDDPAEVLAKKLLYRASELRTRDVFDLAFVVRHAPECLAAITSVALARRDPLIRSLTRLAPGFAERAGAELNVAPEHADLLRGAPDLVSDWLVGL